MNSYIMYNYSFETTYQDIKGDIGDTKYREELLKALQLEKYDDRKIKDKLDKLYEIIKKELLKHDLIKKMQDNSPFPFSLDERNTFILFFSFGFFNYFHKCLQDFFTKGYFTETNVQLIKNSIEK